MVNEWRVGRVTGAERQKPMTVFGKGKGGGAGFGGSPISTSRYGVAGFVGWCDAERQRQRKKQIPPGMTDRRARAGAGAGARARARARAGARAKAKARAVAGRAWATYLLGGSRLSGCLLSGGRLVPSPAAPLCRRCRRGRGRSHWDRYLCADRRCRWRAGPG